MSCSWRSDCYIAIGLSVFSIIEEKFAIVNPIDIDMETSVLRSYHVHYLELCSHWSILFLTFVAHFVALVVSKIVRMMPCFSPFLYARFSDGVIISTLQHEVSLLELVIETLFAVPHVRQQHLFDLGLSDANQ